MGREGRQRAPRRAQVTAVSRCGQGRAEAVLPASLGQLPGSCPHPRGAPHYSGLCLQGSCGEASG